MRFMSQRNRLAEIALVLSLVLIFAFLIIARPPLTFLVLLLIPIALGAVLYEFTGGLILSLVSMVGVALLVALDPDHYRRAASLKEVWPFLVAYLVAGPFVGWLVSQERESERQLAESARRLQLVQDIVRVINTSLNPEDTLQAIIAEMRRLAPFERAAVMLVSGDRLRVVAGDGSGPESPNSTDQLFRIEDSAGGILVPLFDFGRRAGSGYRDDHGIFHTTGFDRGHIPQLELHFFSWRAAERRHGQ